MFKTLLPVAAIFALVVFAQNAQASCDQCFSARQSVQVEKGKLFSDFPGTAASLVACGASCANQAQNDKTGCIMAACGFTCLAIGIENCFNFFVRFAAVADRESRVKTFCQTRGCN